MNYESSGYIPNDPNFDNDTSDFTVTNNAFYPDINSSEFRQAMRVGSDIVNAQVEQALILAIMHTNSELSVWQSKQTETSITDIPSNSINKTSELVHHYHAAVFHYAKSLLVENYRDYDSTKSGHNKAEEMETKIDVYKRVAIENIRKILNVSRMTVELI